MKIGIYGGSFNPPHLGHRRLADFMCESLQLDTCIIMPAFVSPFKVQSQSMAAAEHRLQMCRQAFPAPQYEVSDLEISVQQTSYTLHTLQKLKVKYPDDELFLIIGSDMLLTFNKWYCWQEILKLCSLCAVSRCDGDTRQELEAFAEKNLSAYGDVRIFSFSPLQISSTQLRESLRNGDDTGVFLHPSVADYIREHALYIEENKSDV